MDMKATDMQAPEDTFAERSAAGAGAAALAVASLSHRYAGARTQVLHDMTLAVQPGEILCLVGPSGCGKSTLLRLIAGLEQVQHGSIRLAGELVAGSGVHTPPEKRGVGMVFQDFALFPHMNLLQNVAFGLNHLPHAQRIAQAQDMLRNVGLEQRAQDAPHQLSGGQQQRVALARALAPHPRVLLLDEPFSNLDVRLRYRLRTDTMHLLKRGRIAAIMVTHDAQEAMFMADHIALMNQGRIVQMGSPETLYRQPVNAFAAEFFGETNRLAGRVRQGQVQTPLGAVAAPGLAEGTAVDVLVRPQAIELHDFATAGAPVCVRAAHMLGAYTLVELDMAGDGEAVPSTTLQAYVPDGLPLQLQQRLYARLQPDQGVFVFARSA